MYNSSYSDKQGADYGTRLCRTKDWTLVPPKRQRLHQTVNSHRTDAQQRTGLLHWPG